MSAPHGPAASRPRDPRTRWLLLAGLWALMVWLALTLPPPAAAPDLETLLPWGVDRIVDKVTHAALFLVQTLLLHRALGGTQGAGWSRGLVAAVLLATLYGGLTELAQRGVERRDSDPLDLAANTAGALGYVAWVRSATSRARA